MRYRVYSGSRGSADQVVLVKENLLFKELTALDEALSWSRHLESTGCVPLLIEGDDGTHMTKRDIAEALRAGVHEDIA
jgi:hypothetical protein